MRLNLHNLTPKQQRSLLIILIVAVCMIAYFGYNAYSSEQAKQNSRPTAARQMKRRNRTPELNSKRAQQNINKPQQHRSRHMHKHAAKPKQQRPVRAPHVNGRKLQADAVREDFIDINRERMAHHVRPLSYSKPMQQVAQIRVGRIYDMFQHGAHTDRQIHGQRGGNNPQNSSIAASRIYQSIHHHQAHIIAENLSQFSIGPVFYNNPGFKQLHAKIRNGKNIGDVANDAYMNYDQSQHNGHRKNILDKHLKGVGIGFYYNRKKNLGVIVEDYIG